jgi:hypothetical protein
MDKDTTKDLYKKFLNRVEELGLRVTDKELLEDATYQVYISLNNTQLFEIYIDFATSAWLYFKDLKDGSDEVNTIERWELMFDNFYEIINALYKKPYKEVRFIKKGIDKGGLIEYILPNGKIGKITDLKVRFKLGYSKKTIDHKPLSTQ